MRGIDVDRSELFVVPTERHVERLARDGERAETRTSMRARLAAALLPDARFSEPHECRLVLAMALAEEASGAPAQLDLFGPAVAPTGTAALPPARAARGNPLIAPVRERGGASWERLLTALHAAIGLLRRRGATAEHLDRVARTKGFHAIRAGALATAMRALDARLAQAGAWDSRLAGFILADAINGAPADDVQAVIGARRLRARWILTWEPSEVAWWRALDDKLAPRGGGARVVLPTFDRPIAGNREADPLDLLAGEIVGTLDGPAESETIAAVLGDLTGVAPEDGTAVPDPARVRIVSASDAVAQARAAANLVAVALAEGACVEQIAVGLPVMDEHSLAPLRRALEDDGTIFYEGRGAPPSGAPVVAAALLALDAATSLDRRVVAQLLRSGWIDAARIFGDDRRDAERRMARIARGLETNATAAGEDMITRLVRTAAAADLGGGASKPANGDGERGRDALFAAHLAELLARPRHATTRVEHVRAARALWSDLGIGARAGRGGLSSFTSDAAPIGVPRAERLAIARDARAWEALVGALDLLETTAEKVRAGDQVLDAASFRLELLELLAAGPAQPGAGGAGAVRVERLQELAGDTLDLLIVLDANAGSLPRDDAQDAIVSEPLASAIGRASRGAFVPPLAGATRARELTALAVTAADARLVVLISAREDAAGAPLAASMVVDALARAGIPVTVTEASPPPRPSGVDVTLRAERERQREGFFLDPSRQLSDVVGDLAPHAKIADLLASQTGGGDRALAVTGLERFAQCAFMGYAHVVLAARETEDKEELPDAREEGTLTHEALAAAFGATAPLWPTRPREGDLILSRGTTAADELLEQWQGHAPLRSVVRLRVRDAVRAVLLVAIDDDAWNFAFAEQRFGGGGGSSWMPFTISANDGHLTLRGSIDRIDRARDGSCLRVVDYKRSRSTVQAIASTLGETALQVPLYACVAARELRSRATGVYVPTQTRDVDAKPSARVGERMDELVRRSPDADGLTEIEGRALALVASVRAGRLAPIPARETDCRFCAMSGGCRKPRFAMAPLDDSDEDREQAKSPRATS